MAKYLFRESFTKVSFILFKANTIVYISNLASSQPISFSRQSKYEDQDRDTLAARIRKKAVLLCKAKSFDHIELLTSSAINTAGSPFRLRFITTP